jgi:hypothetical protein
MDAGPHEEKEDFAVTTRTIPFLVAVLLLAAGSAMADSVLYNNGPFDDDTDAWDVSQGLVVSDTFTLMSQSTVTGFQFNSWVFPGDVLTTAEVSITSAEFGGTTFFDQTVNFTQTECVTNAYGFDICRESTTFNGPNLAAGTYWLNLQNARVANGDPVYWDENSGEGCSSPGCPSQASESEVGTIPSESFTVLGTVTSTTTTTTTTSTTPEPGSILLWGSGFLAFSGLRRRLG